MRLNFKEDRYIVNSKSRHPWHTVESAIWPQGPRTIHSLSKPESNFDPVRSALIAGTQDRPAQPRCSSSCLSVAQPTSTILAAVPGHPSDENNWTWVH